MAGLLLFAGYYGLVFVISVYLQQVRGYGPVTTGISFLPSALPITFMPLVAGRINARLGSLRLLLLASALLAVGALLLVLVGSSGPVGMSVGLFVLGVGFGLATVPQITLVMASAPSHRAALASGMLTVGRQSGTTVGVALAGRAAVRQHHRRAGGGRVGAVPAHAAGHRYRWQAAAAAG